MDLRERGVHELDLHVDFEEEEDRLEEGNDRRDHDDVICEVQTGQSRAQEGKNDNGHL